MPPLRRGADAERPGASGTSATRRRPLRLAARVILVLVALAVIALVATSMGRYLARAAWEEGKILARRRSIDALLSDSSHASPALSAAERDRLRLVRDARAFAVGTLGLRAGESFTQYSALDRDTLVLVLSAARRDTLAAYTWWFPVVGRFPYKGFFDFRQAQGAAADLEARGFDTYLRAASAFSTLGWFNDPLLSTTLRLDSLDLVNTVIHELTHNTIFVRNEVAFNESFASFVGAQGAIAFYRARADQRAVRALEEAWRAEKLFGTYWQATRSAVDSAFARHPTDSAARVAARDTVFSRMRTVLVRDLAPQLPHIPAERLQRLPLNNASLLARAVYAAEPWLFDAVHQRAGGDLRRTLPLVKRLASEPAEDPDAASPFERLRRWLERGAVTGVTGAAGQRERSGDRVPHGRTAVVDLPGPAPAGGVAHPPALR